MDNCENHIHWHSALNQEFDEICCILPTKKIHKPVIHTAHLLSLTNEYFQEMGQDFCVLNYKCKKEWRLF